MISTAVFDHYAGLSRNSLMYGSAAPIVMLCEGISVEKHYNELENNYRK